MRAYAFMLALVGVVFAACGETSSLRSTEGDAAAGVITGTPAVVTVATRAPPSTPAATATRSAPVLLPRPWSAPPAPAAFSAPAVSATSAVVLDEASGSVLYDKDGARALPPASLTKIATAIIALEDGDLDAEVVVDVDSASMRGSTVMGLLRGDRFTLRDLLFGMMLPSGNDAALAIGRHLAGSDAAFVARMNALAQRLGLEHTHFANPHGLSARDHWASARDLAILSRYAMSVPGFAEIVATPSWTAQGSRTIALYNINSFLFAYAGADGLKTGFTRRAGPTIVASAVRDGRRLYVVLLNAPQREAEAQALMDWAFAAFGWPPAG